MIKLSLTRPFGRWLPDVPELEAQIRDNDFDIALQWPYNFLVII